MSLQNSTMAKRFEILHQNSGKKSKERKQIQSTYLLFWTLDFNKQKKEFVLGWGLFLRYPIQLI